MGLRSDTQVHKERGKLLHRSVQEETREKLASAGGHVHSLEIIQTINLLGQVLHNLASCRELSLESSIIKSELMGI